MKKKQIDEPTGVLPRVLVVLVLFLGTLAIYYPTLGYGFVSYDDPSYVQNNYNLRPGLGWETVRWAFTSTDYQYNWHPLTWLSHVLDIELFGFKATRHHATNLVLHVFTGFMLLGALRALRLGFWRAVFVTAVFLWHPLRVESVAWISERKDLLSGFFFVAGLWAYGNYADSPSLKRQAAVFLYLVLGLLSKSMVVTLPFVFLLLDAWPLERWKSRADAPGLVREKIPLFLLVAAVCAVTVYTQREGGALSHELGLVDRLLHVPHAITHYLASTFWPVGLNVFYPHPRVVSPESANLVLSLGLGVLYTLLSVLIWRARKSWPELFLGWFWFLGMLVPVIGIVQVGDQAYADRYAYLPGIGIAICLLAVPRALPMPRAATVGLAAAALLAANVRAHDQVGYWRDSPTLWQRALDVTEKNTVAHINMGKLQGNAGRLPEAEEHFRAALEVDPRSYHALINLAWLHLLESEFDQTAALLERAIEVDPEGLHAQLYTAMNFLSIEEWESCEKHLDRAYEINPKVENNRYYTAARNHLAKKGR